MSNNTPRIVSGTFWTTISSVTTSGVHLLRLAVLTRLLEKEDFGLVAIVSVVLGLTQTLSDLGFSSAIMHKKNISRKDFSSLYWIQFIIFFFIYFVIFLFRKLIANFYNEPSLTVLLPVALLDLFFQGVGKLYDVLAQKEFQFKLLAFRNIISAIVSLISAVALAYLGYGVYSLVISSLLHTIILQSWNFIVGQRFVKVQFYISFKEVFPLIKIGLYQMGTQILDYISSKIDIILLGRFLGTEMLGVYNLAKELVLKIVAIINSISNRVALPFFSMMQEDNYKMRLNYKRMISLLSYINFPICICMGALSVPIVSIIYGNAYADLAPLVTIFSVWGMIVCICNPLGNVVTAKGRTDLSFIYTIIRFFIYVPITIILASYGVKVLAIGHVVLAILLFFVSWYLELKKTIGLGLLEYLSSFMGNFVAAFTSILVAALVSFRLCDFKNLAIHIMIIGTTVFFLYYLLLIILDRTHLIATWRRLKGQICFKNR